MSECMGWDEQIDANMVSKYVVLHECEYAFVEVPGSHLFIICERP